MSAVRDHAGEVVGWITRGGCENGACLRASAEGRPWHATPRSGADGPSPSLPSYHFATYDSALRALGALPPARVFAAEAAFNALLARGVAVRPCPAQVRGERFGTTRDHPYPIGPARICRRCDEPAGGTGRYCTTCALEKYL